jgi:peptidylprolyl isomerase
MLRTRLPLLIFAVFAIAGVGCGSNDKASTPSTGQATGATTTTATTVAAAPDDASTAPAVANAKNLHEKPQVARPKGSPPSTLVTKDLVVGTGPAAQTGDTVSVQYVGVSFSNGEEFDTSWGRDQPFTFQLGQGEAIQGWDQGVVGMKVGGRRELVIPPSLGYGSTGQGPILPNETLVFVVDLEKIG